MAKLIEIEDLTVDFDAGKRVVRALHGVSLSLDRGESLGLVGESGSGKSVTWLAVLRLLGKRTRIQGSVRIDGTELTSVSERAITAVRGARIAMIFQDASASLNPVHRIGRQLSEALMLHRGMSQTVAMAEAKRLLDRTGIPEAGQRLREYPHQLSGGMNQRVMIAIALAGEPDLLVADEPTTALDATIQAQILTLLADLRREMGMALVLISHDLGVVADACEHVAVMYCGRIVEQGSADALFDRPAHPYTRGLLAALPEMEGPRRPLTAIPGTVPEPWNLPSGCAFAPRCPLAETACSSGVPPFLPVDPGHHAACIKATARESERVPEHAA